MTRQIVVIGGGPAAHRCVERLVAAGRPELSITVLTEESCAPYDRVALSRRLTEDVDLTLGEPDLWQRPGVELRTGERVLEIDRERRSVRTDTGRYDYHELIMATGSNPLVPPIPGAELCRVYRTLDDVDWLRVELTALPGRLGRKPRVLVVGGGLLGLEAAGGVADLGGEAILVNAAGWLMNTQLDQGGGEALGRLIGATGHTVLLDVYPTTVRPDEPDTSDTSDRSDGSDRSDRSDGSVGRLVELSDGRLLTVDLVIIAIGVRPRDELARAAGLAVGERGGVVIDDGCRTSDPAISAIGEVACFDGRTVGLVAPATAMADVVADRLTGGDARFAGFDTATKLKLSGVDVASFGDAFGVAADSLEIVYADPARGLYQKIIVTDDAKTLLGGIFVGDADPYPMLRPLLGRELPDPPGQYLSVAAGERSSAELPDDAILCSCNNVPVGAVKQLITDGCTDLGDLKACSRAGTGCGSCVPILKRTLDAELIKAGITVSTALCEHFVASRQELFDAVRVLGLTSFEDVLNRYGTGRGCDICKPVIGSILASQRGEYILDAGRGALQDTNDRALANLQRDGTYSVVPRIPGGEITPQKLAVIAEVALEYGLYTKITGGQRIDLLGARLEQLPEIWRKLVDAGFESGHAYGKAVRTVKSCVGSDWCRYGVQDSVGLAIELELRYRGLRAPHKIKLGVSGCARECAEARSKDVGVIATEAGWNLYVGGNGGFQPAHAVLFASDLDHPTLISYIDRFLIYYIRTADRLQRTSAWLASVDGGLDHVRSVVIDDALGIAGELEQAMADHVGRYVDEWAATLADPERLRRFRPFVNAPSGAATGGPTLIAGPEIARRAGS